MARAKILVVDDEELIRWSFKKELSKRNFDVDTAESGEDALVKFIENPPDLVLLDMKLPGMDGLETLKKMMHLKNNILSIMMTSAATFENAVEAMKMRSVIAYLSKPVNLEELDVVIEKTFNEGSEKSNSNKMLVFWFSRSIFNF